jgi:hypothetical protein
MFCDFLIDALRLFIKALRLFRWSGNKAFGELKFEVLDRAASVDQAIIANPKFS